MLYSPPYACPAGGVCKASADLFLLMKHNLNRACTENSLKLEMSDVENEYGSDHRIKSLKMFMEVC